MTPDKDPNTEDGQEVDTRDSLIQSFEEVTGQKFEDVKNEGDFQVDDAILEQIRAEEGYEAPEAKADPAANAGKTEGEPGKEDAQKPAAPAADQAAKLLEKASPEIRALFEAKDNAPEMKLGRELVEAFKPFEKLVQESGYTEAQIVKGWIDLYNFSRSDPKGYAINVIENLQLDIRELAKEMKVDLGPDKGAKDDADDDDDVFADPEVKQLRAQVKALEARLNGGQPAARPGQQQQVQAGPRLTPEQEAQTAIWTGKIQQFMNAKDAQGKPLAPYWNEVQEDMRELAGVWRRAGKTFEVSELYDRAVILNPKISRLAEADKRTSAEAADRQKKLAALEKAKRASSSVRTDSEANDRPPSLDDLSTRDFIASLAKASGLA